MGPVTEDGLRLLEHVVLLTLLRRSCHPVFVTLLFVRKHGPARIQHLRLLFFLCCHVSLILLWLRLMVQQGKARRGTNRIMDILQFCIVTGTQLILDWMVERSNSRSTIHLK